MGRWREELKWLCSHGRREGQAGCAPQPGTGNPRCPDYFGLKAFMPQLLHLLVEALLKPA